MSTTLYATIFGLGSFYRGERHSLFQHLDDGLRPGQHVSYFGRVSLGPFYLRLIFCSFDSSLASRRSGVDS